MQRRTIVVTLGFILGLCAVSSPAGVIRWRSGAEATPVTTSADAAATIAAELATRGDDDRVHFVVQFEAALTAPERVALDDGGLRLLNYLGDHAYFAAVGRGMLRPAAIASVQSLRAVQPIQRRWKLHPSLNRGEVVPWAVVDRAASAEMLLSDGGGGARVDAAGRNPVVSAYVMFHPDVAMESDGIAAARRHGASIRSVLRGVNGLVIEIPHENLVSLADEDAVQYLEPPLPRFTELNDSIRQITGAEVAQQGPYGLDGAGVTVLVYDGGTASAAHVDFAGRVRLGDGDSLSDHATHVAGTIGGGGAASAGQYRGMAPAVMLESYGFQAAGSAGGGFLYTDPGDIEADYADSIHNHGAAIANNSIGTNTAMNGFPCAWTGDYGITSALIDAIVAGSLGAPFRVVWANGNERQTARCGDAYATTAPPACAKNHITVGALHSDTDTVTTFTSWGPSDDGRIKPDVSAPGCQTSVDAGVTSCSSIGGYTVKCGTSMACPTVSGLGALLLEDFRRLHPAAPDFRNSTLKALLAHTAADIEHPGPDFKTGYGSVRVTEAIDQLRSGHFLESDVGQGGRLQFVVAVHPGDGPLRVTLAWDDVPGTPNVEPALVNDLDLHVIDPDHAEHLPWTLDPLDPGLPAVRTHADHLNNIEQVLIDAPEPGDHVVEITGFNVAQGSQTFSLVASPRLAECGPSGRVTLDRARYACTATASVEVVDCDLNLDDDRIDSVVVTATSNSEPTGEVVTLIETGPGTARFEGTMAIDQVDARRVLIAPEGDTIRVTYTDADDGFGNSDVMVAAEALVDCTPPVITDVAAEHVESGSASVVFNTNEATTGAVRLGTTCDTLEERAGDSGHFTAHLVALEALEDDTAYHYTVRATDPAGNESVADDGGFCFTFTTPEVPEYFTEPFLEGGLDLAFRAVLLAPNGTADFYSACAVETAALPTDPAGGTPLMIGEASSAALSLGTADALLFYGVSYDTVYVNANGNLTFGAADTDAAVSVAEHFDQPRIAALLADLDPTAGGEVSWKQLGDRIAITWADVPEAGTGNRNTFQIEVYGDGRIQLAWLNLDAEDGVVGLSQGMGVPDVYQASDLSAFEACGPRAPSAAGRTVVVGQDRPTLVRLLASDDGLPDPPGSLTYVVTSLPRFQLRDPWDSHLLAADDLPHTLGGGGRDLLYTPSNGYEGTDSFIFMASDGGVSPGGGDSNMATVTLDVVPVLGLPFFDDFPWPTFQSSKWAYVAGATIDDEGLGEPSGQYSLRLNGHPVGSDAVHSHLIDLAPLTSTRLSYSYQRTGGGESPDGGDDLFVEFSDAEGVWQLLRQYEGDGQDMLGFVHDTLTLPDSAHHDRFRVRFRSRGTASASTALDDWFVDDVTVTVDGAPVALERAYTVSPEGMRTFVLPAEDSDGDALQYHILSLPTTGSLADPQAGVIDAAQLPYLLAGEGDAVTYIAAAEFSGTDAFRFQVHDGGLASNEATISVRVEPVLAVPFRDTFSTSAFDLSKWSTVVGATVDGRGLDEPTAPYAARFNGQPGGGNQIHSRAINLEGLFDVHLAYRWQRTGGGDSPEVGEDLEIACLDSEGDWRVLARHEGDGPDMSVFALRDVLLPAFASHADFRVRIGCTGTEGLFDDWFVDDVSVFSTSAPLAFDAQVSVRRFALAELELAASDPNGHALQYVILTLPEAGTLTDPDGSHAVGDGDLPYTMTGAGATLVYTSPLGFTGTDEFTFRVNNGALVSDEATVRVDVGGALVIHHFPMDADPGWSAEGGWQFGVPAGLFLDPGSGFTGSAVYGYNLAGPYESNLPVRYLTTAPIDCTAAVNTSMSFHRWLGVEDAQFDHANLQITTNGAEWLTLWEHDGPNLLDNAWQLQTFDTAPFADGAAAVQFRWGMGPTDDSAEFHGWNIDDVTIWGQVAAGPGDIDADGDVDLNDHRVFVACLTGPNAFPAPPSPMSPADCLDVFDADGDLDVDLLDFAQFAARFPG